MISLESRLGILGTRDATALEVSGLALPASHIEDILKKHCKQLLILTGITEFPYRLIGSSTAIDVGGRRFIFCCGHQIDDCAPDSVSILEWSTNHTITGSRLVKPTVTAQNSDSDFIDVRAIEYETDRYGIPNLSHQFFKVSSRNNVWPIGFEGHFLVFGYPSKDQGVDYEIPHIASRAAVVNATYDGSSLSPHVHRVKMQRTRKFDADGMSGGPVFYLGKRAFRRYFIGFAGIVVRGSASSDILHFIEANFLVKMAKA